MTVKVASTRRSTRNLNSTWPRTMRSPLRIGTRVTRRPSTNVPFVEPRSSISKPWLPLMTLACRADTEESATRMSASSPRPTNTVLCFSG